MIFLAHPLQGSVLLLDICIRVFSRVEDKYADRGGLVPVLWGYIQVVAVAAQRMERDCRVKLALEMQPGEIL